MIGPIRPAVVGRIATAGVVTAGYGSAAENIDALKSDAGKNTATGVDSARDPSSKIWCALPDGYLDDGAGGVAGDIASDLGRSGTDT
ncbi:hypothetical protein ABZZ80_27745 [Streptomyces sp. NPDC006356]